MSTSVVADKHRSVEPVGCHGGSPSVHLLGYSLLHGFGAHRAAVCSESHAERTVFCRKSDRLPCGATLGRNWTDPWTTHDPTINLWRHAESLFLIVNNDTRPHDAADKHRNLISLGRGTGEGAGGGDFVRIRRRCGWLTRNDMAALWRRTVG